MILCRETLRSYEHPRLSLRSTKYCVERAVMDPPEAGTLSLISGLREIATA